MAGASAPAIAAVPGRAVAAVPVQAAVLSAQAPATRSRPNLARTSSSPGIYVPHPTRTSPRGVFVRYPTRTSPRGGFRPLPDVYVAHCRFRLRPGAYVASRTRCVRQADACATPVAAYFCLLTCASPHCRFRLRPGAYVAHCRLRLRPGAYVASRTRCVRQADAYATPVAAYFCLLTCASPHCRVRLPPTYSWPHGRAASARPMRTPPRGGHTSGA